MKFEFKTMPYQTAAVDAVVYVSPDIGMSNDSYMTSFEQISEAYSKTTVRKVL